MSNGFILDCILVGVALFLGIGGIRSGLIKELFGLAGVLFGVYLSTSYSEYIGKILNERFLKNDNVLLCNLLGFSLSLVVIWGFFIVLGNIVSKLFSLSGLGFFDKFMGFFFNVSKLLIVFSIILSCVNAIPFLNKKVETYFEGSFCYPFLIQTGNYIANTQLVQKTINNTKEKVTKELEERENKN